MQLKGDRFPTCTHNRLWATPVSFPIDGSIFTPDPPPIMAEFDDSAALTAYKDWTGTVNTLWTIYSAVVVGTAGIAVKAEPLDTDCLPRLILVGSFLAFCVGNIYAIRRAQSMCRAISDVLRHRAKADESGNAPDYSQILESALSATANEVTAFHAILSLLVVLAVLFAHSP
jgi:hypothetical protein